MPSSLKRAILGCPLATAAEKHERLGRVSGLAVLASDALSSVAYGTEEIMLVLVAAGAAAIGYASPITSTTDSTGDPPEPRKTSLDYSGP